MAAEHLIEIVDNVLRSTVEYKAKSRPIIEILFEILRENEAKIVLVDNDTDRQWTAAELLDAIVTLGVKFIQFGISKGDVVAFFCPNSDLHVIAMLSLWAIGAVYTGLIHKSPLRELNNVITKTNATYLVGSEYTLDVCNEFLHTNNEIKKFFVIEECSISDAVSIQCLIKSEICIKEREKFFELMSTVNSNDLCKIGFSSGTTGQPKAITETHKRFTALLDMPPPGLMTKSDTCAVFQPLPHITGSVTLCFALLHQANVVIFSQLNVYDFVKKVLKHSITYAVIVPSYLKLLNSLVSKPLESFTLKKVIIGGEFITKLICDEFIEKFKPQYLAQTYANTESGWITGVNVAEGVNNLTSAGIPLSGCELKIINTETGKSLSANKIGEIYVKGPQLTDGYLNNETANRESFDEQLFFKTGDIGHYDENGYLYITDRIKEIIKYNSQQVSPNELQAILLQHESVKEAAVIGIPDQVYGQLPKAFVVLKELFKGKIMENELLEFVNSQVMDFKKLRGGLVFMNELPKITNGKIDKRSLKLM